MSGYVRCPCCNLPISVTSDDIGLAVTCPRTRKLVPVKESDLRNSIPASSKPTIPSPPPSHPSPRPSHALPQAQTEPPAATTTTQPRTLPEPKNALAESKRGWTTVLMVSVGILLVAGVGGFATKSLWLKGQEHNETASAGANPDVPSQTTANASSISNQLRPERVDPDITQQSTAGTSSGLSRVDFAPKANPVVQPPPVAPKANSVVQPPSTIQEPVIQSQPSPIAQNTQAQSQSLPIAPMPHIPTSPPQLAMMPVPVAIAPMPHIPEPLLEPMLVPLPIVNDAPIIRSPTGDVKPTLSGRWKGYMTQVSRGPRTPGLFFAEATFKQEKDNVNGEFTLAMTANPQQYHTMSVKGKNENSDVTFKDERVVESKSIGASYWLSNRTCTGQISEYGFFSGSWTDPTSTIGRGTFGLVRMEYSILIKRGAPNSEGLIPGKLFLNGALLGDVYEDPKSLIPAGEYKGKRRVSFDKSFVQGPGGVMSKKGDFLLEITGVKDRTDILIIPGSKVDNPEGCILTGATSQKDGKAIASSLLTALRLHFFGVDKVASTDAVYTAKEKEIVIKIENNISQSRPIDPSTKKDK